jgi:hypothetical protein
MQFRSFLPRAERFGSFSVPIPPRVRSFADPDVARRLVADTVQRRFAHGRIDLRRRFGNGRFGIGSDTTLLPSGILPTLGSLVLGGGLMYLLDPERGRRRRALARDKLTTVSGKVNDGISVVRRDLGNRIHGFMAEGRAWLHDTDVPDDILAERVRSKLGYLVSRPAGIDVEVSGGRVALRGSAFEDEIHSLRARVCRIRGVRALDDWLDPKKRPADIPRPQPERLDILRRNWSPATRLFAGLCGGAVALCGMRRPSLGTAALGSLGIALAARAVTNRELRHLMPAGGSPGPDGGETAIRPDQSAQGELLWRLTRR